MPEMVCSCRLGCCNVTAACSLCSLGDGQKPEEEATSARHGFTTEAIVCSPQCSVPQAETSVGRRSVTTSLSLPSSNTLRANLFASPPVPSSAVRAPHSPVTRKSLASPRTTADLTPTTLSTYFHSTATASSEQQHQQPQPQQQQQQPSIVARASAALPAGRSSSCHAPAPCVADPARAARVLSPMQRSSTLPQPRRSMTTNTMAAYWVANQQYRLQQKQQQQALSPQVPSPQPPRACSSDYSKLHFTS